MTRRANVDWSLNLTKSIVWSERRSPQQKSGYSFRKRQERGASYRGPAYLAEVPTFQAPKMLHQDKCN